MPHDIITRLYKAYIVPHFHYCSPLLLGIGKTFSNKLEYVNSFALRTLTLLNQAGNTDYDRVLGLSSMRSIEHRRYEQSLTLFYKWVKEQGPAYITNPFKLRSVQYNLKRHLQPQCFARLCICFHPGMSFAYVRGNEFDKPAGAARSLKTLQLISVMKYGRKCKH